MNDHLSGAAAKRPANGHLARIVVVLGPTASGKSEVAARLAERFGGEVVGCDSMQVYRGFDAGTGKPSPALRARSSHHLIDVADPSRDFSLGDYVRMAGAVIDRILGAGCSGDRGRNGALPSGKPARHLRRPAAR